MPYQFCHHRVVNAYRPGQKKKENLFVTDRDGVCHSGWCRTILTLHNSSHAGPPHHATCHTQIIPCVRVCVSCRRRRLVKVGLGRVKLRKALVDFGNVLCYYIRRVYQDLPHRVTIPKAPSDYASDARNPLPILTISHCGSAPATVCLYQTLPPDPTKPNTPMVLHVSTPTNPYHTTA